MSTFAVCLYAYSCSIYVLISR